MGMGMLELLVILYFTSTRKYMLVLAVACSVCSVYILEEVIYAISLSSVCLFVCFVIGSFNHVCHPFRMV